MADGGLASLPPNQLYDTVSHLFTFSSNLVLHTMDPASEDSVYYQPPSHLPPRHSSASGSSTYDDPIRSRSATPLMIPPTPAMSNAYPHTSAEAYSHQPDQEEWEDIPCPTPTAIAPSCNNGTTRIPRNSGVPRSFRMPGDPQLLQINDHHRRVSPRHINAYGDLSSEDGPESPFVNPDRPPDQPFQYRQDFSLAGSNSFTSSGDLLLRDTSYEASPTMTPGGCFSLPQQQSPNLGGSAISQSKTFHPSPFARELPADGGEAYAEDQPLASQQKDNEATTPARKSRGWRFWITFLAVCVTAFLSAVELTIIAPILPSIAEAMPQDTSISATWITSAFLATSASFQPFFGGLADAIGRREALLLALIIFLGGSALSSVSKNMLEMVLGRGLQGFGGGGMMVVGQIIISDITTLAERGYFLGMVSISSATAAMTAPLAGGWFATFNWRVAFYINGPIGVLAIALLLPAKLSKPQLSLSEKILRLDLVGSLILFASIVSLLLGLSEGGVRAPWVSVQILLPLSLGVVGLALFLLAEWIPNRFVKHPIFPLHLFKHRTAALAFLMTFLHGIILYGATQCLVLYFENQGASPLQAAINILPANVPSTPASFAAGILMAVTGRYRKQIITCEFLMTLGIGLLILLQFDSPKWQWIVFQLIASTGLGGLYSLLLPPIQACLPSNELAHATATFGLCRSFGAVWGVSGSLIIFQVVAGSLLPLVRGAEQAGITGATAIDFVPIVSTLMPIEFRAGLQQVFNHAIRKAFMVLTPFAGLGFISSLFLKHVPLPDYNESSYGMQGQEALGPSATLERVKSIGSRTRGRRAPSVGHELQRRRSFSPSRSLSPRRAQHHYASSTTSKRKETYARLPSHYEVKPHPYQAQYQEASSSRLEVYGLSPALPSPYAYRDPSAQGRSCNEYAQGISFGPYETEKANPCPEDVRTKAPTNANEMSQAVRSKLPYLRQGRRTN